MCCSETARNLGVNFNSAMNLESHIVHVCKIAMLIYSGDINELKHGLGMLLCNIRKYVMC